jgi:hypothetical protein
MAVTNFHFELGLLTEALKLIRVSKAFTLKLLCLILYRITRPV